MAKRSLKPLYNDTQQDLKPDEGLALLAWLDDLFGWESNCALLRDIKEPTSGEETFQQSMFTSCWPPMPRARVLTCSSAI
jgi:hypothetical protein